VKESTEARSLRCRIVEHLGYASTGSGDPGRPCARTRQTYGPERLQAELREDGFPAGIGRIKRLRKKLGLRCQPVRRFMTTTESDHALPVAENVLAQTFVATRPNETWVTDIT
jgi:putative transposase